MVASTVRSENSSLPGWGYSLPSSSTMRTLAASAPALLSCPVAMARLSFKASEADWVKFTYIGLICWITASCVASPCPTRAPSVTSARPMVPEMGAVTSA